MSKIRAKERRRAEELIPARVSAEMALGEIAQGLQEHHDHEGSETAELRDLEAQVNEILASLKEINTYKKSHPGKDVMAIPFSRLTNAHITTRMGISMVATSDIPSLEYFVNSLSQGQSRYLDANIKNAMNAWDISLLVNSLVLVQKSVGESREAIIRITVDLLIIEILRFCDGNHIEAEISPELLISEAEHMPGLVTHGDQYVTYLTGTIDYASVISTSMNRRRPLRIQPEAKHGDRPITWERFRKNLQGFPINLTKAKKEDAELKSHLPQAVGECVALRSKAKFPMHIVPFCLTAGEKWIFGIVDCPEEDNKRCLRTSEFSVDMMDTRAVKNILILLFFWATEDASVLLERISDH